MLNLGNYDFEIWIKRADILIKLGEFEAAVNNLTEAQELHPDNAEIEFRLAGLYYTLNEKAKAGGRTWMHETCQLPSLLLNQKAHTKSKQLHNPHT